MPTRLVGCLTSNLVDRLTAKLVGCLAAKLMNRLTAKLADHFMAKLVDRLTAHNRLTTKLVNHMTAKLMNCLTAKLVVVKSHLTKSCNSNWDLFLCYFPQMYEGSQGKKSGYSDGSSSFTDTSILINSTLIE